MLLDMITLLRTLRLTSTLPVSGPVAVISHQHPENECQAKSSPDIQPAQCRMTGK